MACLFSQCSGSRFALVLFLFSALLAICISCPAVCHCEAISDQGFAVTCGGGLEKVPHGIPTNTIILNISRNNIHEIPEQFFKNLTKLRVLYLNNNHISSLFFLPESLTMLRLSGNNLHEIPPPVFRNLKLLRVLDLSHNDLSGLDSSTFEGVTNIIELNVCCNKLSSLESSTFKGLGHLVRLKLSHNSISRLEEGVFDGLDNIHELILLGNGITWIAEKVFCNLSGLTRLDLRENRLKELPDLNGLPIAMAELYFGHNNITDISRLAEFDIAMIGKLDLSSNQIRFIPPLHNISIDLTLDLSSNKIEEIPDNAFASSKLLQQLMLDHNNISKISSHAFTGLKSLGQLTIFHNKIASISKLAFNEMPLTELLIHNNNISAIDAESFQGLNKTLEKLTLFSNPFTDVPERFFDNMSPCITMAITCSSLLRLPVIKRTSIIVECAPSPLFFLKVDHYGTRSYGRHLERSGFFCYGNHGSSHIDICRLCQPGYRGDKLGLYTNTPCIPCPAGGFYQDEQGQVDCKLCTNGTFVSTHKHPGSSPSDCLACPQGTLTNEPAGYRACKCLPNFYRFDRFGACSPCPNKGVICHNDAVNLAPNYYWKWTRDSHERNFKEFMKNLNTEGQFYENKFSTFNETLPIRHECPRKDSCLGGMESNCSDGYQGPLCAVCGRDYFLRMNTCNKCPSMVRAVLQAIGVVVVFVLVLIAVLWGDTKKAGNNRTWADVILSRFKIVVSFYQVIIAVFSGLARVRWPLAVMTVARWLKYVEANILELSQLSCIDSRLHFNALQQFLLVICCNVAVTATILLYMLIRISYIKQREGLSCSLKLREISIVKRSCYRNIFVFLFTTYPSTCVKITQILPPACVKLCYSQDEHPCQMFLISDLSVQCFTPEHNRYWHAAVVMVLYPVGFPILVLALLWRYYSKLLKKEETLRETNQSVHSLEDDGVTVTELDVPEIMLQNPVDDQPVTELDVPEIMLQNSVDDQPGESHSIVSLESQAEQDDGAKQETSQLIDQEDSTSDLNVHTWKQANIPDVTFSLSLFYENYKPRFWFWEVTEMYRKLVLMCGLVFIGSHSRSQIGIGVLLSGIFSMLHAAYRPITDKSESLLQSIALLVIFFDLSIGVMLKSPADSDPVGVNQENDSVGVSVLFVTVNCLVIGIALVSAIKTIVNVCCKRNVRPCCRVTYPWRWSRRCRLCQ